MYDLMNLYLPMILWRRNQKAWKMFDSIYLNAFYQLHRRSETWYKLYNQPHDTPKKLALSIQTMKVIFTKWVVSSLHKLQRFHSVDSNGSAIFLGAPFTEEPFVSIHWIGLQKEHNSRLIAARKVSTQDAELVTSATSQLFLEYGSVRQDSV